MRLKPEFEELANRMSDPEYNCTQEEYDLLNSVTPRDGDWLYALLGCNGLEKAEMLPVSYTHLTLPTNREV